MGQVTLTIGGVSYRMACDDGQEAHLTTLAERVDKAIVQLRQRFGDIGDQRLTLMAAITLADQQAAAETRLAEREEQLATLIDALAERLEAVALKTQGEPVEG
jgi:cell division protein ZapA